MINQELIQALRSFIDAQDDTNKDEWYCTRRDLAENFAEEFAAHLGIWFKADGRNPSTVEELALCYGDEHPQYTKGAWRMVASLGGTELGYWDWVLEQMGRTA